MGEKTYKTLSVAGAGSIALGIVILVVGVVAGILSIVAGASVLRQKTRMMF